MRIDDKILYLLKRIQNQTNCDCAETAPNNDQQKKGILGKPVDLLQDMQDKPPISRNVPKSSFQLHLTDLYSQLQDSTNEKVGQKLEGEIMNQIPKTMIEERSIPDHSRDSICRLN
jgi:hypothetical protein